MSKKLVRYRVKPEKIEENQRLIEGVFRELHAKSPADVRYLVIKLSDGTFFHLFEDGSKTIPTLDAFAAFATAANNDGLTNLSSSKLPSSAIIVRSLKLKSDRYGLSRGHHDDGARTDQPGRIRPLARRPTAKVASLLRAYGRLCRCIGSESPFLGEIQSAGRIFPLRNKSDIRPDL
jgi:hypothetical protein